MSIVYYIVDTETTGLSASQHEVIEVSIIRCEDRVQLTEFIKAEYPERCAIDALRIQGKTMADLENGSSKEEVVAKIQDFLDKDNTAPQNRCFIGHNVISFDKRFLHALFEKCGKPFPGNLWLDTLALFQFYIKTADQSSLSLKKTASGRASKKLQDCCDALGIKKIAKAHASKMDTRNTYFLWKKLIDEGIDYLPFIKTFPHVIEGKEDEDFSFDDMEMIE